MMTAAPPDPLDLLPDPDVIHERIRDVARAERLLRKLLTLSIAARDARASRPADAPPVPPRTAPASH